MIQFVHFFCMQHASVADSALFGDDLGVTSDLTDQLTGH
jgi:hypothetical protein